MLSAESLEHLKSHKYQTTGYTVLDTKVFNPFWEAFVKMMPMWLAPNLVTVIGLICMIMSYGVMAWYDITFTQQVPCCVLCLSAFLQFMYQTLDACDGKQARRTGSASPLGMLVDHGCDSLTTTVMTMTLIQCLGLGHDFNLRLLAFGMWGVFYVATWEEYHTHFCRTQVFNFGVTENQLFAMFLIVSAGVLKVEFYAAPVTVLGVTLELRVAILYFMVGLSTCTQLVMVASCLKASSSTAMALLRLLPIVMLNGATYCVSHYTKVYHLYPSVCFLLFGLFFSLVVGRLIISSVTKVLST